MLQQEDPGSVPAAQTRVTAEELARAVAQYQARREAAARRLEGTVTLGEALEELGLDVPPEEILAEVEAVRAQRAGYRPRKSWVATAVVGVVLLFALLGGIWVASLPPPAPAPVKHAAAGPASAPAVTLSAPAGLLVQDSSGGQAELKTLGEVADGHPVRCALTATGAGVSLSPFSTPDTAWTLVKHHGRVYLRGWMANMSRQAMQSSGAEIHQSAAGIQSGVAPIRVTLPLDSFRCLPGLSSDEMLTARDIRPDAHFRDDW